MTPALRLAVDTGGTFTDLVVEGGRSRLRFYKRPTTPARSDRRPPRRARRRRSRATASRSESCSAEATASSSGRRARPTPSSPASTARTALLHAPRAIPTSCCFREGGGRTSLFDYTQEYPAPYVPRVAHLRDPRAHPADGTHPTHRSTRTQSVREVAAELRRRGRRGGRASACSGRSSTRRTSCRVGELLERDAAGHPGHPLARAQPEPARVPPRVVRRDRRVAQAADGAASSATSRRRLRDDGFGGRLLIMTSAGGVLDARDGRRAARSTRSAPARRRPRSPVGTTRVLDCGHRTRRSSPMPAARPTTSASFARGRIPWTRETIVGHPTYGYITGFPSVDVRSVGAGGGSIAWVDDGGLLHVGPQSAGADPGPACYGRGGTRPTVTDACLVLGYIDPEYFLGGEMTVSIAARPRRRSSGTSPSRSGSTSTRRRRGPRPRHRADGHARSRGSHSARASTPPQP